MINKKIKPQTSEISIEKARIIAHLMFDGTLFESKYHYTFRYINSSKELINQFIQDANTTYGLTPPSSFEKIQGKNIDTFKVTFLAKEAYLDLLKYSPSYSTSKYKTSIPLEIMTGNKQIKIEFLRAFWEDEGSISSLGRIMGDLNSKKIINQIIQIHNELGLNFKLVEYYKNDTPTYKIYLPKSKENLSLFYNLGLFDKSIITHGRNLGRRKIDVLKEQIEKLKNRQI